MDFITNKYLLLKEERILKNQIFIYLKISIFFMILKFNKKLLTKIKDEANIIIFNSKMCSIENMQTINQIVDIFKDIKIIIPS